MLVISVTGTVWTSTSVRMGAPGALLLQRECLSLEALDGPSLMSQTRPVAILSSRASTRGQQMSSFGDTRLKPISVAML